MTKCPICGGVVAYQGFNNLECHGDPFCPNWVEPPRQVQPAVSEFDVTQIDWTKGWPTGFTFWP